MKKVILKTPNGDGNLEGFHISDLGYLMVKVSFDDKTFTTYNLGIYDPETTSLSNIILENGNDRKN
jgi:hypothetical protein